MNSDQERTKFYKNQGTQILQKIYLTAHLTIRQENEGTILNEHLVYKDHITTGEIK